MDAGFAVNDVAVFDACPCISSQIGNCSPQTAAKRLDFIPLRLQAKIPRQWLIIEMIKTSQSEKCRNQHLSSCLLKKDSENQHITTRVC